MRNYLVIPDLHITPEVPHDRCEWIGKLILDWQPDVIVDLGDFGEFGSLSEYDKGKKSFEKRRIYKDIEAVREAHEILNKPLEDYNKQKRKFKERQYKPRKIRLGGNHDEGRIEKFIQNNAELEGLLSIEQLGYKRFGWEYVPYKTPIVLDGVAYCHYFPSGVMGQPISGEYLAQSLIKKNHMSSTVGHSHLFKLAHDVDAEGNSMWGLSAGCCMNHTPEYADGAKFWWRGIVKKHNVKNGDYSPEFITLDELERRYKNNSMIRRREA